jgi:hypothetical protein
MTPPEVVTWFPDDYELALKMARFAREGAGSSPLVETPAVTAVAGEEESDAD